MHWLNKLERKIGKYAIKNLIVYILGAYAVGYLLLLVSPRLYYMLSMDPAAICRGQVWRLFTWVCTVPQSLSVFTIFMFIFYYWIGKTLENVWGTFRYNIYIFMGIIFTSLGPMLVYLVSGIVLGFDNALSLSASTSYLNWTSFMAYALMFPNEEILIMFILRVRMKWIAIAEGIVLAYFFLNYLFSAIREPELAVIYLSEDVMILFSIINFIVFFFSTRNYNPFSPSDIKRKQKQIKRKIKYKKQIKEATARGTRHYCAVCGRTEESNPELQFRFCSKCHGNLEYCNEHLFTHEHKK